jgi:hypothetical protein
MIEFACDLHLIQAGSLAVILHCCELGDQLQDEFAAEVDCGTN